MSGNFLDSLGISQESFNEASESTVSEGYEVLPSGAYPAKIKQIILYKNKFDGTMLRIEVELTESKRVLSFRSDVGKELKDKTLNNGFLSRLKSVAAACNFDAANFAIGAEIKFNSYGTEIKGNLLNGVNDKPVIALVRMSEDSDRPAEDTYKISNDIEGVTQKGSEDLELFETKVAKAEGKPFKYKSGWKPKGSKAATTSGETTEQAKKDLDEVDF